MKKWIALLMVLLMGLFLFAACGDEEPADEPEDNYAEEDAGGEDEPEEEPAGEEPAGDELEYYDQDFEITNSSGMSIYGLHIMPTGEQDFSHDILAGEEFVPGQTRVITFPVVATEDYLWDIYVLLEDEKYYMLGDPKPLSTIVALDFSDAEGELAVYTTNA